MILQSLRNKERGKLFTRLCYCSKVVHIACRSGTWMMTGNGVMHNGTTMIDQYGQNLDRLQIGDRVGVMRKDNSTLHFYVNGADQGVAAMNVPDRVYGVIDLYGQAAQATIVDNVDFYSPTTNNSSFSNTTLYRCDYPPSSRYRFIDLLILYRRT